MRQKLVHSLHEWLRENYFVSWSGGKTCDAETPAVNGFGFAFDFLGFDYATVRSGRQGVQQPMVGDVLQRGCNLPYAKSFIERTTRMQRRAPTLRAFILASSFSEDALNHLREHGIYPWAINQLFGEKTANAFKAMAALVENLINQQQLDPTLFMEVFNGLENFRTLFGDMKGQLFELMMGYVFQNRGYSTRMAWKISSDEAEFDVDVMGIQNTAAVIVECKGLREDLIVDPGEVKKHFSSRTKLAHRILRQSKTEKITKVEGILVTTASFNPQSVEGLKRGIFGRQSDINLTLWDRKRLIKDLRDDGHSELIEVVNRFYGAPRS